MSDSRSSQGQRSLPGPCFTDPDVYNQERASIAGSWQAIGPLQAFPAGATPVAVDGLPLLVTRDGSERPRVFYNVCRHRGTVLCEEPELGQSRIVCPYHGWSYHLDGSLASAPNMESTAEAGSIDRKEFGLLEVEAAIWQSILFVRVDRGHETLHLALSSLTGLTSAWNLPTLRLAAHRDYDVVANWKLLFQNYSECYHCPTLHPPLNRLTPFRDSDNLFDEGPILGGPMLLADPEGSMTTTGARCAPPLPGLEGDLQGKVYYFTVFPNLFLSLHPDYVLLHRLECRGVDRTGVECWWLVAPEVEPEAVHPAVEFWDTTNRQDWWVCEQMQRGVATPGYIPGPYSALESLVAAFDRHYLGVMERAKTKARSGNPPRARVGSR